MIISIRKPSYDVKNESVESNSMHGTTTSALAGQRYLTRLLTHQLDRQLTRATGLHARYVLHTPRSCEQESNAMMATHR